MTDDDSVPNQHDQPTPPDKPMAPKEMTPAQLKSAIDAMEAIGIQKLHDVIRLVNGAPPADPKEWQDTFRHASGEMDRAGPGGAILIALLPRYTELLAERDRRKQSGT